MTTISVIGTSNIIINQIYAWNGGRTSTKYLRMTEKSGSWQRFWKAYIYETMRSIHTWSLQSSRSIYSIKVACVTIREMFGAVESIVWNQWSDKKDAFKNSTFLNWTRSRRTTNTSRFDRNILSTQICGKKVARQFLCFEMKTGMGTGKHWFISNSL